MCNCFFSLGFIRFVFRLCDVGITLFLIFLSLTKIKSNKFIALVRDVWLHEKKYFFFFLYYVYIFSFYMYKIFSRYSRAFAFMCVLHSLYDDRRHIFLSQFYNSKWDSLWVFYYIVHAFISLKYTHTNVLAHTETMIWRRAYKWTATIINETNKI